MSNLQTGKDTNIIRKIYQSSRFYDKNAFRKQKYSYIFQISAVRTGVCAYKDATPLLTLKGGSPMSVV